MTLSVHNEGAIPESLVPNLFDPFRGSLDRRKQSRGLGLGLFIVREIVRAHGGTVEVSTSLAEGTTFSIRLPRHSSRRPSRAGGQNAVPALDPPG
jgi:signal transduction histidine kinase